MVDKIVVALICCAVAIPFTYVLAEVFTKSAEAEFPEQQARIASYRILSYRIVSYHTVSGVPGAAGARAHAPACLGGAVMRGAREPQRAWCKRALAKPPIVPSRAPLASGGPPSPDAPNP